MTVIAAENAKSQAVLSQSARDAMAAQDWPEALACWQAVLEQAPDHAGAHLGRAQALREMGRDDEAELALADAASRLAGHEQIAVAHAWTANRRRDWQVALARWEQICIRFPGNPKGLFGLQQALRGARQTIAPAELLARAEAALGFEGTTEEDSAALRGLALLLAKQAQDWPALRRHAEASLARTAPTAAAWLALAQASWHLGEPETADRAALAALALDPCLSEALVLRAWIATAKGDADTALACYGQLRDLNPAAPQWMLKHIQLLNWTGRITEAVRETETALERWPDSPMVRLFVRNYGPAAELPLARAEFMAQPDLSSSDFAELRALMERAPAPRAGARQVIDAAPACDVIIARTAGATAALLVFAGSNDAVAMPLPLFDRYLVPLNVTVVYLRDFNRLRYLAGIRSLGTDAAASFTALRALLEEMGITQLFALGNCDGGFGALRYGLELGAARIATFNAPSYLADDALAKAEQGRNFMRTRLTAAFPPDVTDMRPLLQARGTGARIELFYDADDVTDTAHAGRLADLAGVRLHPQPGVSDHRLLRKLALSQDDFSAWLGNLFGLEGLA